MQQLPPEHATLRIVPMPADINAAGDIFGGWLLSQADIAGSIVAIRQIKGRVATVAVNNFHFLKPVLVGDVVSIYGRIKRIGTTSITIDIDIYIERKPQQQLITLKVAEASFVYVHLDKEGSPLAIE